MVIAREAADLHFSVWDFGVREESIPKTSALIEHIYSSRSKELPMD